MNRDTIKNLPILLYTLLLFVVWVGSWVAGIVSLLGGDDVDFILTSTDGVRRFVHDSVECVSAMPWGMLMLLLMTSGVVVAGGLPDALLRLLQGRTTLRMRRALWVTLVTLFVVVLLLTFTALYPLSLTKSVLGSFVDSPMADGMLFVLLVAASVISVSFGVVYGTFRSLGDVLDGLCCRIRHQAPSLVALVPAALLLSSVEYMNLGLADTSLTAMEYIFIGFPFVYNLFIKR